MSLLFTKGNIGSLQLDSRLVMTAIHSGLPFDRETDFLVERVLYGASLVTASLGVHPTAANHDMEIACEENRALMARMADEVDKAGGKLCVQLFHVGRNAPEGSLVDSSAVPSAPSTVPSPIYKTTPKALTREEIREVISHFEKAALLCKETGVHMVEISCSAGYLLSEFLSAKTNLRKDEYGGDFENRMRFPLEVIQGVRSAVGAEYPLSLRVSGTDMLGGYTLTDTQVFCNKAQPYVDAINVTGGWHESKIPQVTMQVPKGGYAFLAAAVKQVVDVPVIACNRIHDLETAEEVLGSGFADFIGSARPFLADSAYAEKLRKGLPYVHCIGCNKGCIENILKCKPITCIFNPAIGREGERNAVLAKKTANSQHILIVGGGPAGLTAARELALAGHRVDVYTKEPSFGGTMHYAKKAPDKGIIGSNIETMIHQAQGAGAKLHTGREIGIDDIRLIAPDRVVVAAGTEEWVPPVAGADLPHVYGLKSILDMNQEQLRWLLAQRVCIIGGGAGGLEVAQFILENSRLLRESRAFLDCFGLPETEGSFSYPGSISILEMSGKIGMDLGASRWIVLKQINRYPLTMMTQTKAVRITPTHVEAERKGEMIIIPADTVIFAAGNRPMAGDLVNWLRENAYPCHEIGDCSGTSAGIMGATKDAYELLKIIE